MPLKDDDYKRAEALGVKDINRKYKTSELAAGDVFFAATGITDGGMLRGVKFRAGGVETETVVMRSATRTVRWIRARHGYRQCPGLRPRCIAGGRGPGPQAASEGVRWWPLHAS